jgi:alkylation response protein AidB-like acyl-CoA dehydrogenase
MCEPEAGSDLASLRSRAVLDGDDFVVDGQKIWTSLGHRADWCALFVRTDPDVPKHKGISCLVVDMRSPGIEARPLTTLGGDDDFAEVFFDAVRVPATALLGPLNGGWGVATNTLSHERAGAARLYGSLEVKLGELVDDLRGASALDDPVTLDRLGDLELRLAQLAVLCKRAISLTLAGGDPSAQASLAKVVWGNLDQDLCALGHEVLGGPWTERRMNSRSLTIAGGTTQVNKNVTAVRVLGLPRS